jgi:hypothetical protein
MSRTSQPLVVRELERMDEPRRSAYLKLIRDLPRFEISEEATILADGYVSRGIFHRKYIANALHVAVASVNKAEYARNLGLRIHRKCAQAVTDSVVQHGSAASLCR